MPKRNKESRSSSRHSGGRFSPVPPPPQRQSRNDFQTAGPSRITNVVNSPIVLTDDDDDDAFKTVDTTMNVFRENGNNLKPDSGGESTRIVKHFVPSADRYQMSQCATDKPRFRGPETDVLHDLEKDKLKNIRVQMIRADVQQNDSFRKTYVVEEPDSNRSKGDKNHQNFDDRPSHFNSSQMHYDNGADKNYGMVHTMSPNQMMSRDRSLSPRINMGRPPSPPLPYSPERDHFNSDNMLRRERAKHSPDRNSHDRQQRPEHFLEQHKMENFSSGPPEPRSPEIRFRSGDHNRHRMKEEHYDDRPRRSRSPVYFGKQFSCRRSQSPDIRPYSPPNHGHIPMSPPSSHDSSSHLRDRPPHPSDRSRRRRSPLTRRDRSRERRRRLSSPRRRSPPPVRSPVKRRENGNNKKRGSNKNQETRKREAKERKRRSESKTKSVPQQEQQIAFQPPPQPQPMYPPPPPPGLVRLPHPPRPFPPGPMMMPLRPPPFPPPMGGWRPPRPPMQAPPPAGWPYPRPRPFYFPY